MARKNTSKRAERIAKNNRRLNSALLLFTLGFVAEFYLLQINNFYVKGTVEQLIAAAAYLEVMVYVGLAIVAAGIVCFALREKKAWLGKASAWLTGLGVFLTLSSQLMRKVYPGGTTALCILVPVLMILSVVYLLYPAEFSVEATVLLAAIGCAALISRDPAGTSLSVMVYLICGLCLAAVIAGVFGVRWLQKNGGAIGEEDNRSVVFSAKTNYALMYAVMVLCAAAILAALFVPGAAYFVLWGGAIVLFLLAVLHTVKML